MAEQVKVIEAAGAPAQDRDGLFKRRGYWHTKLMIGGHRRQISLHTRSFAEARTARAKLLRAEAEGRLPSDQAKWTVAKAVQLWLDSRVHDIAPSSQRRYRELARALGRHFPVRTLGEITAEDIRAYQAARLKLIAPTSINLELRALRMVLKRAKLWARLADDYKPVREPAQGPGRALTPVEEKALFAAAASRPEWHVAYCCAIAAANTTARSCEIRGLRLKDVDLLAGTMSIARSTTKTDAGARLVPLNDASAWALSRLLERARALGSCQPDQYLLPLARYRQTHGPDPCAGGGFDPTRPMSGWRTAWRALCHAAGLDGLRFHDLRHHAITKLAEAGVPDHVLMSMAGHVSRAMLEHYSHVRMEAKRSAVAAISAGAPVHEPASAQPAAPASNGVQ